DRAAKGHEALSRWRAGDRRARRDRLADRPRRIRGDHRPERQREINADAPPRLPRYANVGHDADRWRGRESRELEQAQRDAEREDRVRVSELQPAREIHGPAKR